MAGAVPRWSLARALAAIVAVGIVAAVALFLLHREEPAIWTADHLYIDALVLLLVGYLVTQAFGSALHSYFERFDREGHLRRAPIIKLFVNIVVASILVAALLSLFGVGIENLFFGSAFAGIILGLAGQTVFANVLSGVVVAITGPFRVGERITVISSSYGVTSSSYPHEMGQPGYTGTVLDIGLIYTHLRLDNGRDGKIPNGILLQAMIVRHEPRDSRQLRVRMTFPLSTPTDALERALLEYRRTHRPPPGHPETQLQLADLGNGTWDAVFVIWTAEPNEELVRDEVLRTVLKETHPSPAVPASPAAPR